MQITVPGNIGANPVTIIINGVPFKLGAGETVTVPDNVAGELNRMVDAAVTDTPAVKLPFEDKSTERSVSAMGTRLTAVEGAVKVKELPDLPTTNGTYSLQLAVSSGKGTLTWEADEAASSGSGT